VQIEAKYPYELVAKCYYARQKLMWEILHDGLKYKIEIQYQNISAIRAVIEEHSPGILEIEVYIFPSLFYIYIYIYIYIKVCVIIFH